MGAYGDCRLVAMLSCHDRSATGKQHLVVAGLKDRVVPTEYALHAQSALGGEPRAADRGLDKPTEREDDMPPTGNIPVRGRWYANSEQLSRGAVGGAIGGVVMAMVSMILFPVLRIGSFWQPMNLMAAVFHQPWGSIEGFALGPLLVGMAVHMTMSVGLGLLFASFVGAGGGVDRLGGTALLIVEAVFLAMLVWILNQYVTLPVLDPVMARRFPHWLFAFGHAVYGGSVGGSLAWSRTPIRLT